MTDISIREAKQDKLFYVVANIIIVNPSDKTCLILKRSDREKVHPGKWGFPGGKLEHSDVNKLLQEVNKLPLEGIDNILGKLAAREAEEECGLKVNPDNTCLINNKVFVRPDGVPVFLSTLATTFQGGSVELEADAFSDFAWVGASQLADYDCIGGVPDEARTAMSKIAQN